jgi:uncharacterized membrane protein
MLPAGAASADRLRFGADDHGRLQIGHAATNRRIGPQRSEVAAVLAPDLEARGGMLAKTPALRTQARASGRSVHRGPSSPFKVQAISPIAAVFPCKSPISFAMSVDWPTMACGLQSERDAMKALILYVAFVAIGAALSATIGYYVEREFGSGVSLIVFLAMFFANFAVSWLAVILVMDGSLRDAWGRQSQLDVERTGRASVAPRPKA